MRFESMTFPGDGSSSAAGMMQTPMTYHAIWYIPTDGTPGMTNGVKVTFRAGGEAYLMPYTPIWLMGGMRDVITGVELLGTLEGAALCALVED